MISRRRLMGALIGLPFVGLFCRKAESSSTCSSTGAVVHFPPPVCDELELPKADMSKREYNAEVIDMLGIPRTAGKFPPGYVLVDLTTGKFRVAKCMFEGEEYERGQKLILDTDKGVGLYVAGIWNLDERNLRPAPDPMTYDEWVRK